MRDLLFVGLFALFLTNTHAADINDLTYDATGDTVIITDCAEDASGDLVIPENIEGKPVATIDAYAFSGCSSLSDITIGISVTSIGDGAFSGCSSLSDITIPDGVTSIGAVAFRDCSNLTSITIPNGVTSIGDGAFSGCESLTTIEVGAGNMNFTGINGVLFNAEKTVLVAYPAGKAGANYTIHDGVTSIRASAFSHCSSLTGITIPQSVTTIGSSAFYKCTSLTSITIPDSVTGIGGAAFWGCASLTSITIPDSVTSIGSNNFYGCTSLTSITIPDSVTSIGWSAFRFCRSLTSITFEKNSKLASIDDYAFYFCKSLTSITIPDRVASIGNWAFSECTSLTDIDIPNSVTSIGDWAFYRCLRLTSITIPDSVINIGEKAFQTCNSLYWIKLGRSVATIGSHAFAYCRSLTSITIPENVTRINYKAFNDCEKLKSITFESNDPPTIGDRSLGATNKILYVPKGAIGYDDWDNSEGYIIKSINAEFEYVDCSIIKLKDNENIRLSFSGESEKEYFIQRSCDLEHWEILEGNIQHVVKSKLIFDEQQQKKALVPTEDIGNDWIQLNYDDSNWLDVESVSEDGTLVGGGVGFARSGTRVDPFDPYIALDLEEQMYRTNASVYIRIPFTIDDLSEIDSLILAARTDDGFVAWLNGNKVQSFKAPDEPQWDSGATASNSDSIAQNLREFSLDDHIDKLRVGENIIAIQALNVIKSSRDFLFSCNLLVKRIINVNSDFSIDYPLINPTNQNQLRSQFYRVISQ